MPLRIKLFSPPVRGNAGQTAGRRPAPKLDRFSGPDWLGPLQPALVQRNHGRPLPVIHVTGLIDHARGKLLASDRQTQLLGLKELAPDRYVYATVTDFSPESGYHRRRLIVATLAALAKFGLAGRAPYLRTTYTVRPNADVHRGNGQVLFLLEYNYSPELSRVFFNNFGLHRSLSGQMFGSAAFASFVDFLRAEYGGLTLEALIISPIMEHLFLKHFPAARSTSSLPINGHTASFYNAIISA